MGFRCLKFDLRMEKASFGPIEARLATEVEFISRFPECEIGAMPSFGNLFDLAVYIDPTLSKDDWIYFNAGNHAQTVRLQYRDFVALVTPKIAALVGEIKKRAA